jgi:hypothetical protein
MYIGDTRDERRASRIIARPNLTDTVIQRRFDRQAAMMERRAQRDLERAERRGTLSIPATPSEGSPVVTTPGNEPAAQGSDAGASAGGGTSTVNVEAPSSTGGSLLLPLALGAAALFLL